MTNWKELPKDRPILVKTNSGEQYRLENWRFDKDGSIVGWAKSLPLTIPYYNIATIATIDETNTKIAKTSFIIAGSVCGILLFIYIINGIEGAKNPLQGM